MIEIKGGKKEQSVRKWINETHEGKVPRGKVLDSFSEFEMRLGAALDEEVSYGLFNECNTTCRNNGKFCRLRMVKNNCP